LMKGICLVVERGPTVARRGPEHMIGHFNVGKAEVFGGLRPVADLCWIVANIARWKHGVKLHDRAPVHIDHEVSLAQRQALVASTASVFAPRHPDAGRAMRTRA